MTSKEILDIYNHIQYGPRWQQDWQPLLDRFDQLYQQFQASGKTMPDYLQSLPPDQREEFQLLRYLIHWGYHGLEPTQPSQP